MEVNHKVTKRLKAAAILRGGEAEVVISTKSGDVTCRARITDDGEDIVIPGECRFPDLVRAIVAATDSTK